LTPISSLGMGPRQSFVTFPVDRYSAILSQSSVGRSGAGLPFINDPMTRGMSSSEVEVRRQVGLFGFLSRACSQHPRLPEALEDERAMMWRQMS